MENSTKIKNDLDNSDLGFDIFILFKILNAFDKKQSLDLMIKEASEEMYDFYSQQTGRIEISRENKIERVYFRIPAICSHLDAESKDKLLWSVDRSTQTSKLQDFFDKSLVLLQEMEFKQTRRVATSFNNKENINFFSWNANTIANISFLLSIIINLFMISYYQYDNSM